MSDNRKPPDGWDVMKSHFFNNNYVRHRVWASIYATNWFQPALFVTVTLSHICFLVYTATLTMDDEFEIFAESVHFALLLSLCCTAAFHDNLKKGNVDRLCWNFDRGLHDYRDTLDSGSAKLISDERKRMKRRKKILTRLMAFGLVMATAMLAVVRPSFEFLMGKYENASYSKGIVRIIPIACWVPYDGASGFGRILVIVTEYYFFIQSPPFVTGTCVMYLAVCEELCFELSMLRISLTNLKQRAEHLSRIRGQKTLTKGVFDECLKRSIIHYQNIRECFELVNDLYKWTLFVIFLGGAPMLCLSGFMFSSDRVEIGGKISSAFFLTLEILHYFIYCWYGEQILDYSENLGFDLYCSDWTSSSLHIKTDTLIIQSMCFKPLRISPGGFTEASLNTFSNMLSSAYSYFNVLRASIE